MRAPLPNPELYRRQDALQAEAGEVLAALGEAGLFEGVSPPLLTGSYVSGLMCWRDLDIMVLGGCVQPSPLISAPTSCASRTCGTSCPATPTRSGARDIYTAVLDHGIRTPEEFGTWLAGGPGRGAAGVSHPTLQPGRWCRNRSRTAESRPPPRRASQPDE
ncbi:hypothetical protein AB0368_08025 [Actinoplanes sp. NPDC051475]|uniref:hypothetical protein n=1 Tax=Actinoplanes sp. NPDC051475 TaxID=3157225 RepID=UPI0034508507